MNVHPLIRRFIETHIPFARTCTLSDDMSLVQSGLIGSLDMLALLSFLESQFEVSIASSEIVPENFDSLSNIAAYVERKCHGAR
jgi:acyl carrier protein